MSSLPLTPVTPTDLGGTSPSTLIDVWTPHMFGAVGDSVTLDDAALASWVAADGPKLASQEYTYLTSTSLVVPAGTTLDFGGATLKKQNLGAFYALVLAANTRIRNLNITGNRAGGATQGGILCNGANIVCENVTVDGCQVNAFATIGGDLRCYACKATDTNDGLGLTGNGNGFFAVPGGGTLYTDEACSASGNVRSGYSVWTNGCEINGYAGTRNGIGLEIRSANDGRIGTFITEDADSYGVYADTAARWKVGTVTARKTGFTAAGPTATNVEMFSCSNWEVGSLILDSAGGYELALSGSTDNRFGVVLADVGVAIDNDPGISFVAGSSRNHIGYAAVRGKTFGWRVGEGTSGNEHNSIGVLVAESCSFAAVLIDSGNYNTAHVISHNSFTTDPGQWPGLITIDGVGNVFQLDHSTDTGQTKPQNIVVFQVGSSQNRVPHMIHNNHHTGLAIINAGDAKNQWGPSAEPAFGRALDGCFADYSHGVDGVDINVFDPPDIHWIDQIVTNGTGTPSLKYSTGELAELTPALPGAVEITTSSNVNAYMVWTNRTYGTRTNDKHRLYVRLNTNNTAVIRLASVAGAAIEILGTRKVRVWNIAGGAQVGTTTAALTAGQWYRIEWGIVHGTAGTVEVRVYPGHSTTQLDGFTTSAFSIPAASTTLAWGHVQNSSLGGNFFQVSAVASGGNEWYGPWTEPSARSIRLTTADGTKTPFEITNTAELIVRTKNNITHDLGPSPHYMYREGTEIMRIGENGLTIGQGGSLGNPDLGRSLGDIQMKISDLRPQFLSETIKTLSDPPDSTYVRYEPSVSSYTGTGAATTNGSAVVTISDHSFSLTDRGRSLTINAVGYNILDVTGANSCTVTPTPAATGSGLAWTLYTYPYPPGLAGLNFDSSCGQPARWTPGTFALRASGVNGLTSTAGLNTVTLAGRTSADIGRALLINNDPTLAAAAPERDCFVITNVVASTLTLDANVPSTLANVAWSISDAAIDGTAVDPGFNNGTLSGKMAGRAASWGTGWTAPMDVHLQLADNAVYTGSTPSTSLDVVTFYGNGQVLFGRAVGGFGYKTGAGGTVTQSTNKSTGVTLNKVCGQITMNGAALAADTTVSFVLTDSAIAATDVLVLNHISGGTVGAYHLNAQCAAGSATINVTNRSTGSLSEAVVIQFVLVKAVTA